MPAGPSLAHELLDMLEIDASDAVPRWLAARLVRHCAGSSARVLHVHPPNAARVKEDPAGDFHITEDGAGEARPVRDDGDLLEALRLGFSTLLPADDGTRVVFVLHVAGEVRYAIDIRSASLAFPARVFELAEIAQAYFERLARLETDALTRLRNRRVFQKHVDAGIGHWARSPRAYHLAVLDIDHFKRVNDTFGHLYGDEILMLFAQLMRRTFRATDRLYRFGGEEFVVIYSTERSQPPQAPLERFRQAVEAFGFPGVGRLTASSGFARIADASIPSAILVERADAAMYYAKAHGRNRVCGWEDLVAAGEIRDTTARPGEVTLF